MTETKYKINIPGKLPGVDDYLDMMHDENHELYYKDLSLNKIEAYCRKNAMDFSAFWKAIHEVMNELKEGK